MILLEKETEMKLCFAETRKKTMIKITELWYKIDQQELYDSIKQLPNKRWVCQITRSK